MILVYGCVLMLVLVAQGAIVSFDPLDKDDCKHIIARAQEAGKPWDLSGYCPIRINEPNVQSAWTTLVDHFEGDLTTGSKLSLVEAAVRRDNQRSFASYHLLYRNETRGVDFTATIIEDSNDVYRFGGICKGFYVQFDSDCNPPIEENLQ